MKLNRQRWFLYTLQAFAISVVGPALFYLCQPIFDYFEGNRDAIGYVDTYIKDWDSIKVVLPKDLLFQEWTHHTKYIKKDKHTRRVICADNEIYYIPQYKKFFEIVWIQGIDTFSGLHGRHYDAAGVQCDLMRGGMILSVYVNRKQWKDKSYGTKEKPVPVFLHRIISGDDIEQRNAITWKRDSLYPKGHFESHYLPPHAIKRMRNTPDSINRKFVEYYLRYLLPEEEFDRFLR